MPVYFFTFHAYRSWMPDRGRGYVRRHKGILPPDKAMADAYRGSAVDDVTILTAPIQRTLLEEAQIAAGYQNFTLHGGSTEPSHLHLIVSWRDQRSTLHVRNGVKQSLSRRLTRLSDENHVRFSDNASQKRVRDQEHLTYLLTTYLPKHRGFAWYSDHRAWIDQLLQ